MNDAPAARTSRFSRVPLSSVAARAPLARPCHAAPGAGARQYLARDRAVRVRACAAPPNPDPAKAPMPDGGFFPRGSIHPRRATGVLALCCEPCTNSSSRSENSSADPTLLPHYRWYRSAVNKRSISAIVSLVRSLGILASVSFSPRRNPRSNTPLECFHIYKRINIDTLDLIGIRDWEETASREDAKTVAAVMLTYFPEFHEIENQGAGDKRPQIAAHPDIGSDAVEVGFFESNRMAGSCLDPILDIGPKAQNLVRLFPHHCH